MGRSGIVLISHHEKIAKGLKEIIRQVTADVPVATAGGTNDGDIGTSMEKILAAIDRVYSEHGVILFYDLGSARMNAELACELYRKKNVHLVHAPLIEGAYLGAVESSVGRNVVEIIESLDKHFPITE